MTPTTASLSLLLAVLWVSVTSSQQLVSVETTPRITSSQQLVSVETTARVLLALRGYFKTDCLAVVTSDVLRGFAITARFGKAASQAGVATTLLDAATLLEASERSRHCLRPLHLLLYDEDDVRTQLSQTGRLSKAVWVMFLEERQTVETVFADVYIPFDCEFLVARPVGAEVRLYEVYRVASTWPLRSERFGSWSADKGLTAPPGGLYTRRVSLHGLTLRATNVHDPPLSLVAYIDGNMRLGGFCGSIWNQLEMRMNFTTIHSIPEEGGNRWEEMMHQLIRGEADVTATYIAHTANRDRLIDFGIPLRRIPLRIFIAEPTGREVEWSDFLSPFSPDLWLALLVSTIAAAALLALFCHVIRRFAHANEHSYPLVDSIFLVFGSVFCQQGHSRSPQTSPCRIVHYVTLLVGVIIINSYSGALVANLAVYTPAMPFQTLHGLYEQKHFAIGMVNKSLTHIQFKNAEGGILQLLYERHINDHPVNTPVTYLEGFQRVCATTFAFIALSETLILERDKLNCSLVHLSQQYSTITASLAFPKGSPYRGFFNHNLLRLWTGGIITLHYKMALEERPSLPADEVPSINMAAVIPIHLIMAAGIVIASILFVVELVLHVGLVRLTSATTSDVVREEAARGWSDMGDQKVAHGKLTRRLVGRIE